uniref:isthmin-1 isoform X2 n=1 Tax=Myxine glutinosa TaxID=7769 RepID=UPI00358E6F0F
MATSDVLALLALAVFSLHIHGGQRAEAHRDAESSHAQRRELKDPRRERTPESPVAPAMGSPETQSPGSSYIKGRSPAGHGRHRSPRRDRNRRRHGKGKRLVSDSPEPALLFNVAAIGELERGYAGGRAEPLDGDPNIQVTIEVVDEPKSQMNFKRLGGRPWGVARPDQPPPEERNVLNPLLTWFRGLFGPNKPKASGNTMYGDSGQSEWGAWSACSVTCGSGRQQRIRSCGPSCTATESRACEQRSCSGARGLHESFDVPVSENVTELLSVNMDNCERWMNCRSAFLLSYTAKSEAELPACPCHYPAEVAYGTAEMHDILKRRLFRWKDASGPKEHLDVYKPTARYCIRSLLALGSSTLSAQYCCYDGHMRLLTRGKGSGSPNLISTEFSAELHHKVDVVPWLICKGDWSRYHQVRKPNNALHCVHNPSEEVYRKQLLEAQEY